MNWLNQSSFSRFVVLLVALASLVSTYKLSTQNKKNGGTLAHECANFSAQGKPIILLHGLTSSMKSWDGIYPSLPLVTRRRVCMYDARNHGRSSWNETFDVDALAEDLKRFMQDMKIDQAALIGHSMGGLTAMKFALKYPNKVEKMVIEDMGLVIAKKDPSMGFEVVIKLLMTSLNGIPPDADEDTAKKYVSEFFAKITKMEIPESFFEKNILEKRDGKWQWKANLAIFLKAFEDLEGFIGEIKGTFHKDTLFIYGTASPIKVGEQKTELKKIFSNAEFYAVEGASHNIHQTYPVFLKKVTQFLKQDSLGSISTIPSSEIYVNNK